MVISTHFKVVLILIFAAFIVIGVKAQATSIGQKPKASPSKGSLNISLPSVLAAMNETKCPSSNKAHNSTPADIFATSMSALAKVDLRAFALTMTKSAQSTFLGGRSIDDPYFETLPQKMVEAEFETLTVESFKQERKAEGCKLIATISSVHKKQKIIEEITMELIDSSSGWLIDKYENRTVKRILIQNN